MTGCQSTSHKHDQCSGFLWQCADCGRVVCCTDGGYDDERCDECWAKHQRATAILQPTVAAQVEADGDMLWA